MEDINDDTSKRVFHQALYTNTMRPVRSRSGWKILSAVGQDPTETVPCLQQDLLGIQKDKPIQGNVQANVKAVTGPETTREWQVNP